MMKRFLSIALLATMFVGAPVIAADDKKDAKTERYEEMVKQGEDQLKKLDEALEDAKKAFDEKKGKDDNAEKEALEKAKLDRELFAGSVADTKARLEAHTSSKTLFGKIDKWVRFPWNFIAGNKLVARGASAAGVAGIAYTVYNMTAEDDVDEEDFKSWQ